MERRGTWGKPVVKVTIYLEGGGDRKDLRTACRKGFSDFFRKLGFDGSMPSFVACGPRNQAFKRFCIATKALTPNQYVILLVDSEEAYSHKNPWEHLSNRDNWIQPSGTTQDNVFLMVECMENWFLADRKSLPVFFGQGFRANALPPNNNPECITKSVVLAALKNATRDIHDRDGYKKSKHSFALLGNINAQTVIEQCSEAKRLVTTLKTLLRPS